MNREVIQVKKFSIDNEGQPVSMALPDPSSISANPTEPE